MASDEVREPGVQVAKYDRAQLTETEVQPIAEEDGHVIFVNSRGSFGAKVEEVDLHAESMTEIRDKVHKAHMAMMRRRQKKTTAVPAVLHVNDEGPQLVHGFFQGVHAGNGDFMYRLPTGDVGRSAQFNCHVFHPDDPALPRLAEIVARQRELRAELDALHVEAFKLLGAQMQKMLKGVGKEHVEGYRMTARKVLRLGHIRNDAELALKFTEAIVANVLKPKEETPTDE